MPKYRKKPEIIEAFRYDVDQHPEWFNNEIDAGRIVCETKITSTKRDPYSWCRKVHFSNSIAEKGDYVVKHGEGNIAFYEPEVFENLYELDE